MWLAFVQHLCLVLPFILNSLAFVCEGLCRGCFGGGQQPAAHRPDSFPSSPAHKLPQNACVSSGEKQYALFPTAFGNRQSCSSALWFQLQPVAHADDSCGIPKPREVKARTWEPSHIPFLTTHLTPVASLAVPLGRSPALTWHRQRGCAASAPLCITAAKSGSARKPRLFCSMFWAAFNMGRNTLK